MESHDDPSVPPPGGEAPDPEPAAARSAGDPPTDPAAASGAPAGDPPTDPAAASGAPAGDPPTDPAAASGAPAGDPPTDPAAASGAPAGDPPTDPAAASGAPAGDPPTDPAAAYGAPAGDRPRGPRRLFRSREDRVIGGVCAGVARYFDVDPVIVRVVTVALTLFGGAGLLLYLAALLLVPSEGSDGGAAASSGIGRALTVAGVVVLVIAATALFQGGWWWGGFLVPLTILALAGLVVWWVAAGERPAGTPADVLRRALLGVGLLLLCAILAFGAAWAAAAGGGTVVAALVIAAGLALVAGAFAGGLRWLMLPALTVALAAGFVAAAGIDLQGGYGEREYRPAAATDVRPSYELAAGRMVIDLRDANLPAGDRPLSLDIGMGEAVLVVPENVCVASRARIGMGEVRVFDRESAGVDVDWEDERAGDTARTPRLVVDADIGMGALQVRHDTADLFTGRRRFGRDFADELQPGNAACRGRTL